MTKQIRVSEEYRAFLEAEQARFRTSFIKIVPTIGVPVLLFFSYGDWLIARDHYLFFLNNVNFVSSRSSNKERSRPGDE
jgi:hypothetical protein